MLSVHPRRIEPQAHATCPDIGKRASCNNGGKLVAATATCTSQTRWTAACKRLLALTRRLPSTQARSTHPRGHIIIDFENFTGRKSILGFTSRTGTGTRNLHHERVSDTLGKIGNGRRWYRGSITRTVTMHSVWEHTSKQFERPQALYAGHTARRGPSMLFGPYQQPVAQRRTDPARCRHNAVR